MADVETLIEMGFSKEKAEYALEVTNNRGVEAAMEWLLAHGDEEIPPQVEVSEQSAQPPEQATLVLSGLEPKSIVCDDCGKIFVDQDTARSHAAKTNHSKFSESTEEKPALSEEQRKEQLQLIEDKLKQKRKEREERERADDVERERNRIKSGKDLAEARRKMEELEMKKIVDERQREKMEEKAARDRVRAQIEADKAARKIRNGATASPSEPNTSAQNVSEAGPNNKKYSNSATPAKSYKETRIQIRLQDGSVLTETFNVKEQLSAVRVFIEMKTGCTTSFNLMTTFPRKVFQDEDFEKPLDILGLIPTAVITVTKKPDNKIEMSP